MLSEIKKVTKTIPSYLKELYKSCSNSAYQREAEACGGGEGKGKKPTNRHLVQLGVKKS